MDQYQGDGKRTGSEDASEAREHLRHVEENRDALEAQARRTEATAPADVVSRPVQGLDGTREGREMNAAARAAGEGSEDASRAAAHAASAERNRDALEEQNRRVEETAPDSVDRDLRDR